MGTWRGPSSVDLATAPAMACTSTGTN
jgi:hypothetical protein